MNVIIYRDFFFTFIMAIYKEVSITKSLKSIIRISMNSQALIYTVHIYIHTEVNV